MKMRRLLVAACAAMALALACVTGELRGVGAVDDQGGDVASAAADTFEALPAVAGVEPQPPPPAGAVFDDLPFPSSRMMTADVFRPPRA
ncbi:MAG TPA: hypothetical protein VIQ54_16165 [Polyangia bacterium]